MPIIQSTIKAPLKNKCCFQPIKEIIPPHEQGKFKPEINIVEIYISKDIKRNRDANKPQRRNFFVNNATTISNSANITSIPMKGAKGII